MIVTVAVVLGFKHTIRGKVVGFGSHIQIQNLAAPAASSPMPIAVSDTLMKKFRSMKDVSRVAKYSMTQGLLKTDTDFLGVAFKGVGEDYDTSFLSGNLQEGKLPAFSSSGSSYELVVSRMMADKLQLNIGDRVFAYFIGLDDVRVRKFTVSAIYQTNMNQFDQTLCFTNYNIPLKLNNWEADQCSGVEIAVKDFDRLQQTAAKIAKVTGKSTDRFGESLVTQTIYESYPNVFAWLSLLDINVWIILVLMICVAGFTMVSGLLIIILERTQLIGILKALGMRTQTVRRTFLWFGIFIMGRGLLIGNIIGIAIVVLQQQFGFIHLDASSYYVDTAPMELDIPLLFLLNVATVLLSAIILLVPTLLVSRVHPARSMRYE